MEHDGDIPLEQHHFRFPARPGILARIIDQDPNQALELLRLAADIDPLHDVLGKAHPAFEGERFELKDLAQHQLAEVQGLEFRPARNAVGAG